MKTIIILISCILVGIIIVFPFIIEEKRQHLAILNSIVNAGNQSLPVTIDDITSLDSLENNQLTLQFNYTVIGNTQDMQGQALLDKLNKYFNSTVCSDELIRNNVINNGIPVVYAYHNKAGEVQKKYKFDKSHCR